MMQAILTGRTHESAEGWARWITCVLLAKRPPQASDLLIIGGIVAAIIAIIVVVVLAERARRKAITAKLTGLGLSATFKPDPELRVQAFGAMGLGWSGLKKGAAGIQWCATGNLGGLDVTLIEHRYTTGSGKNRSTHYHLIAATPAPPVWPSVELAAENFFHRIGQMFGSKDMQLDDPTFNKRWRVKAASEDFAVLTLTPEVQQWSMGLPSDAIIRIGGGAVTICRARSLHAEAIGELLERCTALRRMLPVELDVWGAVEDTAPPARSDHPGEQA